MSQPLELHVDVGGGRLDRYVSDHLPELSRAAVQRLIDEANIVVNRRARKPSYRVEAGDSISIAIPPVEPATLHAEPIPLDVLYEDSDVLVINKPAGMVVHPATGHTRGTLANAVLAHAPDVNVGGAKRPGIVHRLDSETSGLIVVAKNDAAMQQLQAQWKSRLVKKTYLALLEGRVDPPNGKIDAPIGRDFKNRQKMAVVTRGHARIAVTVFHTLANLAGYTLVRAEPETGRTHQIRVHFAFLGHPVIGDAVYGKKNNPFGLTRQFLHAWKLALVLPSGRPAEFEAPLPADLVAVLEQVGYHVRELTPQPR
ncbi:MAG: RluA family pseudouridine synthase [Chloroflexi bacterium]|nr:RluA family pseudouridine synthase [Chloroflexota bacterium]